MKATRLLTVGIAIFCLFIAQAAWAATDDAPHTAVYDVPDLNDGLSKKLVKGLGKLDGVVSAKPDATADTISVTFVPQKTDTETIQAALTAVAPQAALNKVGPADPSKAKGKSPCSGCPKKSGCSKKK
jgi:hypothetical protein